MSAETLRKAAALMRERAVEAAKPENSHPYGDKMFPPNVSPGAYGAQMREYLGGPWGEQAASWHPAVALAVADLLEELADHTDVTEDGDVVAYDLSCPKAAGHVASAYLGETDGG